MAGVIDWYYNNEFRARRYYHDRIDRKETMRRIVDSVGVNNRHKMYFVLRPSVTLKKLMEEESQLRK